jgi:hypothetical protein
MCRARTLTFGWAALPACTSLLWKAVHPTAVVAAATVGQAMAKHRIDAAKPAYSEG